MTSRYSHDYEAFERLVLNAPFMEVEMRRRAELVKAHAEAHAPYDADDSDGQHYRDAFEVSSGRHGGAKKDRAYGRVTNDDPAAVFVEYGRPAGVDKNGKPYPAQARHRTLGNALDAAKH
jgi:hypothetical protein